MSSPLRSGVTAAMAAVYVALTASVFVWGIDLAVVSGIESLLEALYLVSAVWEAQFEAWRMMIAAGLTLPVTLYLGVMFARRAYRVERSMTDI